MKETPKLEQIKEMYPEGCEVTCAHGRIEKVIIKHDKIIQSMLGSFHMSKNIAILYNVIDGRYAKITKPAPIKNPTIEQIKKMYPEGCEVECALTPRDIVIVKHDEIRKYHVSNDIFIKSKNKFYYLYSESENTYNYAEITKPAPKLYPKVMVVWDADDGVRRERVVFMEKCGRYIAWTGAKTLEDAENKIHTSSWRNAKDIPEVPEVIEAHGRKYKLIED